MIHIQVDGHLLIPFGRPKWDISKIRIAGVSTTATYFNSETPCIYIDKSKKRPAVLRDFAKVFPERLPKELDPPDALTFMQDYLKNTCQLQTPDERRFLDLYFGFLRKRWFVPLERLAMHVRLRRLSDTAELPKPLNHQAWVFDAALPLPQAHLYLDDPLRKQLDDLNAFSSVPGDMFKVDFAFWSGSRLVAVEVDGGSHIGSESHVRKDRMLQRAGVEVVHILNRELEEFGERAISTLLPDDVLNSVDALGESDPFNPLGPSYGPDLRGLYDSPF